jgi:hypothetical protein
MYSVSTTSLIESITPLYTVSVPHMMGCLDCCITPVYTVSVLHQSAYPVPASPKVNPPKLSLFLVLFTPQAPTMRMSTRWTKLEVPPCATPMSSLVLLHSCCCSDDFTDTLTNFLAVNRTGSALGQRSSSPTRGAGGGLFS